MLDTPQITQTTAQLTAIIHLTIPREEMQNVFGPSVAELMTALAAQGIAPAGPVFTHHLRMAPVYHGPYEGLPAAWGEFMEWIAANGYKPAEDLWECYTAGPHTSPDPTTWRTELNRPLEVR